MPPLGQTVAIAVALLFLVIFFCVEDGLAFKEGKEYRCKKCEAGRYPSPCVDGRRQEPRVVNCGCIYGSNTPTFMACDNGLKSTDAGATPILKELPNLCCPHPECKEEDPNDSVNCYIENDIALLVDSSEEIEVSKWPIMLNITKQFLDGWIRYGHPLSRMAWMVYSGPHKVYWNLEFSRTTIIENIETIIKNSVRYDQSETVTSSAMESMLLTVFQTSVKKDIKGLRKSMVVITDSQIKYTPDRSGYIEAERVSAEVEKAGILPYIIGIEGSYFGSMHPTEMRLLAGPTGEDRVIAMKSYVELEASVKKVTAEICYRIKLRQ